MSEKIEIYVDGGVKNNKAYASVYSETENFVYYSLLGGVGHITTTQAETLALYNGMCLAEKILYVEPTTQIIVYTDLEFLYEIMNGVRPIKGKYFKTYKGLRKLLEHPVFEKLGYNLEICKVESQFNRAHSVIRSSKLEINEEVIIFSNKEYCDKWNKLSTPEGLLEAYINMIKAYNCTTCKDDLCAGILQNNANQKII